MYHYLKWAALSLFFRRNLRSLVFILISMIGIVGVDAIYSDLMEYFIVTDHKEGILYLLAGKWTIVIVFIILLLISVMRLGFSSRPSLPKRMKDKNSEKDPIMERLEKFRKKEQLKHRSDLVIERLKKEKRD